MHIKDLEENEYPVQATSTNEYELNGNQNLSIVIKPNKVNLKFLHGLTEMWTITDHDGVPHKIVYLKKKGEGILLTADIKAIPLFFDDFKRFRIYDRIDQHMTAAACFGLLFEDTDYNYVITGSFSAVQWEGFGDGDTKLNLFKRALDRYKAEFRIEGNTIYIETLVGRDTGFMYRYRLNASNIVTEHDANDFYTYGRGYGDYGDGEGGEDWQDAKLFREYTSPLASIPGIGERHAPRITNGNITDGDYLYDLIKKQVDESLKISATATIHDLREQGYNQAQPEVGDRVFLIDERIGFDEEIRIVSLRLVRDWRGKVINLDSTFGTPGLVKRHQSRLDENIKRVEDIFEGREPLPYDVLPEAIRRASEALLGAMTELEVNDLGIIARSVDDPNHLVIYNSAGLGVSTNGGQTFENAITYLGINTNLLTAGDIHTNNIRIIGTDTYFYWDGTGLYAIHPNDVDRYVRLRSTGLHIAKGAITIERPDGGVFMLDGIANLNYTVQFSSPPFKSAGVVLSDQWYRTDSTVNLNCDMGSFRHEGRYLKVTVAHRMDTEGTSTGAVSLLGLDNWSSVINASHIFDNAFEDGSEYHTFTIDLGVPSYQSVSFYVQLRTGASNRQARTRILRAWQEG